MWFKILLLVGFCAATLGQEEHDPEFLKGEPREVVNSFHALLENNHEHTDAQIEDKIQEWLKKQTPELRAKYDKFVEENKKREKAVEEAHARSVTKLSAEAKEADKKLWEIAHSPTLTGKQKQDQIQDIIKSLPPKVKEEIDKEQSAGQRRKRKISKRSSGSWSGERRWGYGGGWRHGWGGRGWGYQPWGWSGYGWGK